MLRVWIYNLTTKSEVWTSKQNRDYHNVRSEVLTAAVMKKHYLLGHNAAHSAESKPMFRRNILPPSSGSNKPSKITSVKPCHLLSRWYPAWLIRPWRWRWWCSETSVDFQRTIRHYIPEDKKERAKLFEEGPSTAPVNRYSRCTVTNLARCDDQMNDSARYTYSAILWVFRP
jgi:hypothetical protein